jgi:cytochrome c-type biogenesis protein CcmH
MRNSLFVAALGTLLLAAAVVRGEDPAPTVKSVGDKVMCLCGCVAILNQCPHQGCSTHEEVNGVIAGLIAEGKSEPEILEALTARYGMKILAAPPAKGFVNIAAWVLPGLGLIFGLLAVILIVRRLRRPAEVSAASPAAEVDPKVLAALEAEIKESGLGAGG